MTRKASFFPALTAAVVLASTGAPSPVLAQSGRSAGIPECSERTLPRAERVALEQEFARRFDKDGKTSAETWLRGEAEAALDRLADQGICTMPGTGKREVVDSSAPERKIVRDKDGKPCKRTRLANRVTPGFGGAPMTMTLVPVCAD